MRETDSLLHAELAACVGLGWRQPHYAALMAQRPPLGFLQVHSENFFAPGGAALRLLQDARAHYGLSLHGVGLALGSAQGLDEWHLERLAELVERVEPLRVSDHASFARVPGGRGTLHANDLLPISFSRASLDILCANVQRVQERLGRQLLVENLSAYLGWGGEQLEEVEFFNSLTARSGCGLLLDVNNLYVNALNRGEDESAAGASCRDWIDALRPGSIGEIHLAGHSRMEDIVIDDHGSPVAEPVWQLFRHAIDRHGPVPSLIEWDTDLPALDLLLEQTRRMSGALQVQAETVPPRAGVPT